MKNRFLYLFFAGLVLALVITACHDEEKLLPLEHKADFVKTFPEGDNAWDRDLVEIADRFGVKCIYDDLTFEDISKAWVATSGEYVGEGLPKDSIRLKQLYTRFMKEHVFAFLNPDYTKGVLPNYIYFAERYLSKYDVLLEPKPDWYQHVKSNYNGMGFWLFCWATGEFPGFFGVSTTVNMFTKPADIRKERENILKEILKRMVDAGNIEVPVEFFNEFDYKTEIMWWPNQVGELNYYKRRGFPEQLLTRPYPSAGSDLMMVSQTSPTLNFVAYLCLALRYPAEVIEENYKDFNKVIEYYYFTVDYMKEQYDMDLTLVAEEVTEDLDAGL